jgi:hypothetical protein
MMASSLQDQVKGYGKTAFNAALGTAGSTMSENSAISTYFFKRSDLNEACAKGELRFKWRSCHGNSYRLFMREDLENLAKKVEPDPVLFAKETQRLKKQKIQSSTEELARVRKELDGWEERKKFLNKRKSEIEGFLEENGVNAQGKKQKKQKTSLLSTL